VPDCFLNQESRPVALHVTHTTVSPLVIPSFHAGCLISAYLNQVMSLQQNPRRDRSYQESPSSTLHNLVGTQASVWLEETRHKDDSYASSRTTTTSSSGITVMWIYDLCHMAAYVSLVVLLILWIRRHYVRHERSRQQQQQQQQQHQPAAAEQVDEIIFVLGIPLLIPRMSSRSQRTEHRDDESETRAEDNVEDEDEDDDVSQMT